MNPTLIPTGRPTEWSEEMDKFLVDHINRGWSYLAVAKEINRLFGGDIRLTRNSVAGRKYRLSQKGVVMKKSDAGVVAGHINKQRARMAQQRKTKERKEKRAMTSKTPKPAPAPAEVVRIRNPATGQLKAVRPGVLPMTADPKTILELGRRQCRAAVGEAPRMYDGINNPFLFCGARTDEGETYCPDHAGLMYAKPKPRSEGGFILGRIGTNKGAA